MAKRFGRREDLRVLWPNVSAVIFDVEGTLVDAVPLTLLCWQETLEEHGFAVSQSVLQCLSGMDGHDMLARITPELPRKRREEIIAAQGNSFKSRYLKRVRPFRSSNTVLHQLRQAGRKIGIATDCGKSELDHYLHSAQLTKLVDCNACGDDARHGKPHADLLKLALGRLRVKPSAGYLLVTHHQTPKPRERWEFRR